MQTVVSQNISIIDNDTGENISDQYALLMTQEEKESWTQKRKEREEKYYKRLKQNERGYFVMMRYEINKCLDLGLSAPNVTRLMYLATFMDYQNFLRNTNNWFMTKEEMRKVMSLKADTFQKFYRECINSGILNVDEGKYSLNQNIFHRGEMNNGAIGGDHYTFIYYNAVREIYEKSSCGEHKGLAILFLLIPYVNKFYNVVCRNVTEEKWENMECMTLNEIGELLGIKNIRNIKAKLSKITVGGKPTIVRANAQGISFIFINDSIYYGGGEKNRDKVSWISGVCDASCGKDRKDDCS